MIEPTKRELPLGQDCGAVTKSMAKLKEPRGFVKGLRDWGWQRTWMLFSRNGPAPLKSSRVQKPGL